MRKLEAYSPETEDWAFHVILPFAAYALLLVSALLLGTTQEVALILVAVVVLALIFIGIHDAWDVAVFLVTRHPVLGATDVTAAAPPVTPEPIAAPVTAQSDGSGSLSPG